MTASPDPRARAGIEDAVRESGLLVAWLFRDAFPLWWSVGADTAGGGFFEKIDAAAKPLAEPRRTRVVARQIYSYATAARMGWPGPALDAVRHGLDFFHRACLRPDGTCHCVVEPDGRAVKAEFDLYDHAFALFGLAAAAQVLPDRCEELAGTADRMRRRMAEGWSHPWTGFEEASPRSLPLKANPHMHLLEACLAWEEVSDTSGEWRRLADRIAELCLARFIEPGSGALREFFDSDWAAIGRADGQVVEPGHQCEWAWLLARWGLSRRRPDALAAAKRLVAVAETYGVDRKSGLMIEELWDDLTPKKTSARLWPQTERIKAWVAMAWLAEDAAARDHAFAQAAVAARGLRRFLDHPVRGAFWTVRNPGGEFEPDPAPASSLYHIVCAIDELLSATSSPL